MKASEVRAMSVAELNTKLDALKKDLFMLRMQHATNQLDNPQKLVQTKRDIARVKTMIREKERSKMEEKRISSRKVRVGKVVPTRWTRPSSLRSLTAWRIPCTRRSSAAPTS